MNAEKLQKLQAQVRLGGKGTQRRKKKVVHRTATTDDKKLQSSLKKLSVRLIWFFIWYRNKSNSFILIFFTFFIYLSYSSLQVNNIPGIEEVNMIKDDGSVIHFNNPKVRRSDAIQIHYISVIITELLSLPIK